jgi:hypothetical protein
LELLIDRTKRLIAWRCAIGIEERLDKLPPVYTPAIYQAKWEAVYQHVYDISGAGDRVVSANRVSA